MIELKGINKTFRVSKRNAGFGEAVKELFKREYTEIQALNNVSFTIGDGEMVGYIGPNGAGKSSTIKIMSGILNPDSGECVIDGRIPWKERRSHVKNIGVVFGQRSQLWWDVPIVDSFSLLKDIYSIDDARFKRNCDELCGTLGLESIVNIPARQLSLGQRMRCELAASLLHDPRILFLDEPTIGLDAASKIAVRDFIKKINRERGTTVILTTHDMQDIEALTERILLIGKGRILLDGSLAELKRRSSPLKTLTIEFSSGTVPSGEGIAVKNRMDGHAVLEVNTETVSVSDAIARLSRHMDIRDISVSGVSAEEMVVSLYEEFGI